jgi:hypothetical protein
VDFSKETRMDRRNFFSNVMAAAVFSGAFAEIVSPKELMAAVEEANDVPQGDHQQFWDGFFDDVDPTKPHATGARGPGGEPIAQPLPTHIDDAKLPRFFHYDDAKGLRYAEKIDRSELPKLDGAAVVSMSISGFRPSDADSKRIGDASSAQLQLHATQTMPMAQYIAPLAWASLASVFRNQASKLPSVDQLNFVGEDGSTGTSGNNRILLPGAEGKLALNLTLPDKHSLLHKVISYGLQGAAVAAPLVALPAISVPAIKAFTSFYNILVQNAGFIINSPLKDVVASYDAVDSGNMHADALKLLTGQYLIAPANSISAISAQMDDLKMMNGYLVPKSIPSNADPVTVAQSALPAVTYATLKVSVQAASDVALPAAPKNSQPSEKSAPSSGDSKKPGSTKKSG